jgi:hypothetical protein
MDGTSMACPLVAGAAALLHSAAIAQGAQLSYGEVKRLLLSTVDPCPTGSTGATISGGRLNVDAAMAALALLLHERGLPELPGGWLAGDGAEAVQRRLLENPWGQELLAGSAPTPPTPFDGGSEGSLVAQESVAPGGAPLVAQQLQVAGGAAAAQVQAASLMVSAQAQRPERQGKRKLHPAGL